MADTALVFNALSGPEILKAVLADIEKKLVATGEFDGHVTFPWFKYNFQVSMVVYPKQAVDAEPGIKVAGAGEQGEVPEDGEDAAKKTVLVADTVIVDTPDLTRIESGQPVPTPGKGVGNVLVDKLVTPAGPKDERRPFGYKGTDGKGKSDGTAKSTA